MNGITAGKHTLNNGYYLNSSRQIAMSTHWGPRAISKIQITEPARFQCLTHGTRKCGSPIEMDGSHPVTKTYEVVTLQSNFCSGTHPSRLGFHTGGVKALKLSEQRRGEMLRLRRPIELDALVL
jgi:hypothetical protein